MHTTTYVFLRLCSTGQAKQLVPTADMQRALPVADGARHSAGLRWQPMSASLDSPEKQELGRREPLCRLGMPRIYNISFTIACKFFKKTLCTSTRTVQSMIDPICVSVLPS